MHKEIVIELRIPESEFKDWVSGDNDEDKKDSVIEDVRKMCRDNYIGNYELKGEVREYI